MIIKIFWQESCSHCHTVKSLGKDLGKDGIKVEYHDINTPDGLAESMLYDVLSTPSLVITDDQKKEITAWRGETPKIEELKKFIN